MFHTRKATPADKNSILDLYKTVAQTIGGIARTEKEITEAYISSFLQKSLGNGIIILVPDPENAGKLVAEIHCYQPEPKVFGHILGELTIVVHPAYQGKGIGGLIFTSLLSEIETTRPDILRVELIARESNQKAIGFYQKLGFRIEGRMENRINAFNGSFEADIPMAWFNKNFQDKRGKLPKEE